MGIIIYGLGLIAKEYYACLVRSRESGRVDCFALTEKSGLQAHYEEKPVFWIGDALAKYPQSQVIVAVQEKFHEEIRTLLSEYGKSAERYIGLCAMSELLRRQVIEKLEQEETGWRCTRDRLDDTTCVFEKGGARLKFYPMGQMQYLEELAAYLRETAGEKACESQSIWGKVRSAAGTPVSRMEAVESAAEAAGSGAEPPVSRMEAAKSVSEDARVFIGMASSAGDAPIEQCVQDSEWVKKVFAGDNIPLRNRDYAELSATYWMWKNLTDYDYLGLCHYRRHFVLDGDTERAIRQRQVDVLLTTPRLTMPSVRDFFVHTSATAVTEKDFELMMETLRKKDKDCWKYASEFTEGCIQFPNNMVIARREIFDGYCSFLFDILREVGGYYEGRGIRRGDRYLAYLGEMLTSVYFTYYCRDASVRYVDYRLLI